MAKHAKHAKHGVDFEIDDDLLDEELGQEAGAHAAGPFAEESAAIPEAEEAFSGDAYGEETYDDAAYDDGEVYDDAAYDDGAVYDDAAIDGEAYDDAAAPAEPVPAEDQAIFDVKPVAVVQEELTDYERSLFGEAPIDSPQAHAASRRMRKKLLIAFVILIVLVLCGVLAGGFILHKSQKEAAEHAQETEQVAGQELADAEKSDVSLQTGEATEIPELMGLFGKKQDACVKAIGHGATVTATTVVKAEKKGKKDAKKKTPKKTGIDALIKSTATVELSDEPAEEKTGKPTVRLYFDKEGKCIQVGYSAGVSSLGYSALSFADVVESEHAVENTLRAIGLDVKDGTAKLPEKVDSYTTYNADSGMVSKEKCQFKGKKTVNGKDYKWEAVLLYDYVASNATGNLADTVRQMYVYVAKAV